MNAKAALAFMLFLATVAVSQNVPNAQSGAQCKFSDGKRIALTPERRGYRLWTNGTLIAVGGIVPAGDYVVVPEEGNDQAHFLSLQKATETGEPSKKWRIPMTASTLSAPQRKDAVSFVSTGGSCKMQLASAKSSTLLSLEFTEKNTDLPLVP